MYCVLLVFDASIKRRESDFYANVFLLLVWARDWAYGRKRPHEKPTRWQDAEVNSDLTEHYSIHTP